MRIAAVDVVPLRLPFREEFRIARGTVGSPEEGAPHLYVRVADDEGGAGWGEARPSPRWSYETPDSVLSTLRGYLAPAVIGCDPWDLRALHERMEREIAPGISTGAPIAKSAIDMAVHDLLARRAGVPLVRLLGGGSEERISLTHLISVESSEEAARRARAARDAGFRGLKVKIGAGPERDLALLRAVREAAPDLFLWADANQAYSLPDALVLARKLEPLDAGCLEQPLPANDVRGLALLSAASPVPIAADEGVFAPSDLLNLIERRACSYLVVKISRLGGIRPAFLAARVAREAGLGILGSGLTESRLGFAAHLHLLAACGGCRFADLNGPQFLDADPIVEEFPIEDGFARVPVGPGLGATPDPAKLERFRA